MNYYEILGVPTEDPSEGELKKAYRKAAAQAHPDKEGGSHEAFLLVQKAYEVLSDPFLKKAYDLGCPGATLDKEVQEAAKEVTLLFTQLVARVAEAVKVRTTLDLVRELKSFIANGIQAVEEQLRDPLHKAKGFKTVYKRLKKTDSTPSFLHDAISQQRRDNWRHYRDLQGNRRHLRLMMQLADQYSYEVDVPEPKKEVMWLGTSLGSFRNGY